jgi:hypothetical protein
MFLKAEEEMAPSLALCQRLKVGACVGYSRRKDGLRSITIAVQKVLE